MRKLIWKNSLGDEINLTKSPFGIINWEGFSNAPLNIQSQQVPMQDGSVFLDALIENRDLSVTLSIQDGNDLEKRYELERQLIHILNPKLGEGYLIYTNDFISKRIKCIPQIPLFPNKNSNDPGTQKGELSWTACEPYWEDLEETVVYLNQNFSNAVVNNGDVKIGLKLNLTPVNCKNPKISNITQNKNIQLLGENYNNNIYINTETGQKGIKTIEGRRLLYKGSNTLEHILKINDEEYLLCAGSNILYTKDFSTFGIKVLDTEATLTGIARNENIIIAVGQSNYDNYCLFISNDNGKTFISQTIESLSGSGIINIIYSEIFQKFIIITCSYNTTQKLYSSSNGVDWELNYEFSEFYTIAKIAETTDTLAFSFGKHLYKTQDLINWVSITINENVREITEFMYSKNFNTFIIAVDVYSGYVTCYKSDNLQAFTQILNVFHFNNSITRIIDSIDGGLLFFIYATLYYTNDLTQVRSIQNTNTRLEDIIFHKAKGKYYITGIQNFVGSYNNNEFQIIHKANPYINIYASINVNNKYYYGGTAGKVYVFTEGKPDAVEINIDQTDVKKMILIKDSILILTRYKIYKGNEENFTLIYESNIELNDIMYSDRKNKIFVCRSNGTLLISSDNAVSWITKVVDSNNSLYKIAEGNEFLLIGGKEGLYRSYDGLLWNKTKSYSSCHHLIYSELYKKFFFVNWTGVSFFLITTVDGENISIIYTNVEDATIYDAFCDNSLGCIILASSKGFYLSNDEGKTFELTKLGHVNSISKLQNNNIEFCGNNFLICDYGYASEIGISIIDKLSANSDIDLGLSVGKNELLLDCEQGELNGILTYRQKYIGV